MKDKDVIKLDEELINDIVFSWDHPHHGYLSVDNQQIDFANIEGVVNRLNINSRGRNENENYILQELSSTFFAWIQNLSCVVINKIPPKYWYHEAYNDINEDIKSQGIQTLNSLFTNSILDSQEFLLRHSNRAFICYLSPYSKIFELISHPEIDLLKDIVKNTPVKLMEHVEGERIEAFIIGSKVIITDTVGNLVKRNVVLEKIILDFSNKLGITFIQLHLLVSYEGNCYCLGLDVVPDYEQHTEELRHLITDEVVRVLEYKK